MEFRAPDAKSNYLTLLTLISMTAVWAIIEKTYILYNIFHHINIVYGFLLLKSVLVGIFR